MRSPSQPGNHCHLLFHKRRPAPTLLLRLQFQVKYKDTEYWRLFQSRLVFACVLRLRSTRQQNEILPLHCVQKFQSAYFCFCMCLRRVYNQIGSQPRSCPATLRTLPSIDVPFSSRSRRQSASLPSLRRAVKRNLLETLTFLQIGRASCRERV